MGRKIKNLSSSEAVYGFVAWLTTRSENVSMGAGNDCAPIADLVKEFCEVNDLPEVREKYYEALVHPGK